MYRNINDQLFTDLHYDEVDMQRVMINPKVFKTIEFTNFGFPLIIISIMSYFSKESESAMYEKKQW